MKDPLRDSADGLYILKMSVPGFFSELRSYMLYGPGLGLRLGSVTQDRIVSTLKLGM